MPDKKKTIPFVDFGQIHWFHDANIRGAESFGDPISDKGFALTLSLANGWDVNQGVVKVTRLTPAQVKKAITERKSTVANYRAQEVVRDDKNVVLYDTTILADLLEKAYKTKPVFGGNTAYRRSFSLRGGLAIREFGAAWYPKALSAKMGADEWPQRMDNFEYLLPIEEKVYDSDADLFLDHLQENLRKDVGKVPLSTTDLVVAARTLLGYGFSETAVARQVGLARGTVQKVYGLARLDKLCPKAKLIDRLGMAPDRHKTTKQIILKKGGAIPFGPLGKEEIRKLAATGKVSESDIDALVKGALSGDKNLAKVMSGKDIRTAAEGHDCTIVKVILDAVARNDEKPFIALGARADAINDALASVDKKYGPPKE